VRLSIAVGALAAEFRRFGARDDRLRETAGHLLRTHARISVASSHPTTVALAGPWTACRPNVRTIPDWFPGGFLFPR